MKIPIIIALLLLSTVFFSQSNTDFDNRLLVKFTKAELIEMKKNQPDRLENYEYCLDNASYFVDVPKGKDYKHRITKELEIKDVNNYNIYALDITPLENDYQYFSVKDKNILLVLKSFKHIQQQLKSDLDNQ